MNDVTVESSVVTDELLISLAQLALDLNEQQIYQIARQLQAIRSHCSLDAAGEAYRQHIDRVLSDRLDWLIDKKICGVS